MKVTPAVASQIKDMGGSFVDGAAAIGKATEMYGLVISHVICVPMIIVALWLLFRPQHRTTRADGRVSQPPVCEGRVRPRYNILLPCEPGWARPNIPPSCTLQVEFTTNTGFVRTLHKQGGASTMKEGDTVDVWYNADDPNDADLSRPSRAGGWVMLLVFGGYLAYRWIKLALISRFRWLAAYEGVGDVASLLKH